MNKKEKEIRERRDKVLRATLRYYGADPDKRRCTKDGQCRYSGKSIGKNTAGCAVGRLLPEELRLKIDKNPKFKDDSTVQNVAYLLPKEVKELGIGFLADLQELHDNASYWGDKGLSSKGRINVRQIREFHING